MLVPHGDDQWFDLIRMVGWILVNAEELGVTQDNVEEMYANSPSVKVQRLLGAEGTWGQERLQIAQDVAVNVIKEVGNFGEIIYRYYSVEAEEKGWGFYRERGPDNLYFRGGLMYVAGEHLIDRVESDNRSRAAWSGPASFFCPVLAPCPPRSKATYAAASSLIPAYRCGATSTSCGPLPRSWPPC